MSIRGSRPPPRRQVQGLLDFHKRPSQLGKRQTRRSFSDRTSCPLTQIHSPANEDRVSAPVFIPSGGTPAKSVSLSRRSLERQDQSTSKELAEELSLCQDQSSFNAFDFPNHAASSFAYAGMRSVDTAMPGDRDFPVLSSNGIGWHWSDRTSRSTRASPATHQLSRQLANSTSCIATTADHRLVELHCKELLPDPMDVRHINDDEEVDEAIPCVLHSMPNLQPSGLPPVVPVAVSVSTASQPQPSIAQHHGGWLSGLSPVQTQLEHASDASGPPSPAVTAAPPTPRLSRLSLRLSLEAAVQRPLLGRVLRRASQPHLMSQAALSPSPASMSPPACAALAESHEKYVILAGAQRCCMKCAVQSPATELTCNRINTRVSLSHSTTSACLAPAASLSCSVTFVGEYCACDAADALPNGSVPTAFSARRLQAQTNCSLG